MQAYGSGDTLSGGFTNPPIDAAYAFRSIMQAMAQPGSIHILFGATPPAPLSVAAGTAILTMCDTDTPIYLAGKFDCLDVRNWITFHTGAPITHAANCTFAIGCWAELLPVTAYPIGTSEYPDRSATLIVETDNLCQSGFTLKGPGIRETAMLSLPNIEIIKANHALFPLGLDFLFTCQVNVAALPRSLEVSLSANAEIH
jgi:alpha-D-ribose 1-methylphosphonate 5-triphosphate synthase subunit PhnH